MQSCRYSFALEITHTSEEELEVAAPFVAL